MKTSENIREVYIEHKEDDQKRPENQRETKEPETININHVLPIKKRQRTPETSPETKQQTTKTKSKTTPIDPNLSKAEARGRKPQTNSTKERPAGSKKRKLKRESIVEGGRGYTDIRSFGVLTKGISKNRNRGHKDPKDPSKEGHTKKTS